MLSKSGFNLNRSFFYCVDEDEQFLKRILLTDQSYFDCNPRVNEQNIRLWRTEKPDAFGTVEHFSKKVGVRLDNHTSQLDHIF